MEVHAKIIQVSNGYEWHIYIENPIERFMGFVSKKENAYFRLNVILSSLGLKLKYDIEEINIKDE